MGNPTLVGVTVAVALVAAGLAAVLYQLVRLRLGRGEVATADIGPYPAGIRNLVTVVGFGRPGHSALVLISDDPGPREVSGASIALPYIAWDSTSGSQDQNLRWGR